MISKIRNRLKKVYVKPVYDDIVYDANAKSFCGCSLEYSNVLVITYSVNEKEISVMKEIANMEQCHLSVIDDSSLNSVQNIMNLSSNLMGSYKHFINIFDFTNKAFDDSLVTYIYNVFQNEIEYLLQNKVHATICSIIRMNRDESVNSAMISGYSNIIRGLGEVFPNHNVFENGIITSKETPISIAFSMALFMSGKYGHILNGEIVNMK